MLFFVFFFKQKTAYEMRISDWSSDVCSSDLARYILERASARETTARVAVGALCKEFLRPFGVEILSHVVSVGSERLDRPAAWHEIGRASCRERVCQYV